MTFALPEDVSAYQKAYLDTVLKFADATTERVEQWFDLSLQTAKAANAETMKQIRQLAVAKDVQELASLQTDFAQANAQRLAGLLRAVQSWAVQTQSELAEVIEAEVAEINKTFSAALDKAAQSAPQGSELAFSAAKQVMTATNQACDALAKAGKQMAEMTEATVAATTGGAAGHAKRKTPPAAAA
jgi:phasin family protein